VVDVGAEMLPVLREEAAARQKATQLRAAGPGRGRKTVRQKVATPFSRDKNRAVAEAAAIVGTNRTYVSNSCRGFTFSARAIAAMVLIRGLPSARSMPLMYE